MKQAEQHHPGPETGRHLSDEDDIGSGEQDPGQEETEELIRQIPPLPDDGDIDDSADAREVAGDNGADIERMEQEQSRDQDEPDSDLDQLDPVPPKGR